MTSANSLDAVLSTYTTVVGPPVTDSDIDARIRLNEAADRSKAANAMAQAWESSQKTDRRIRIWYAYILLVVLAAQLIFLDYCVLRLGKGEIKLEQWVVESFIVGVFAQVISLSTLIVKYLFPDNSGKFLDIMERMAKK